MALLKRITAYCFSGSCDTKHIAVLDGIRALAILGVVWYHFWQQSWVELKVFGFSLDNYERCGYLMVDLMLLLSGFCLYLPYASAEATGQPLPDTAGFYRRRAARILPSYYGCLAVILLFFILPGYRWGSMRAAFGDILPHLTLTQNLFRAASYGTLLNGALWTVAVEVQLYLIFPCLARWFTKRPALTYLGMVSVGLLFCYLPAARYDALAAKYTAPMVVNNTLSFLTVYANGMLGAMLYVRFFSGKKRSAAVGLLATAGVILCVWGFWQLCCFRLRLSANGHWQLDYRYLLSFFFLFWVFCVILCAKPLRWLFDNRLMVFLAGISYNLYIWHQYLAVQLKANRIPYYTGDTAPNILGDKLWQAKYLLLCSGVSLAAAIAFTYLVEKPCARLITGARREKTQTSPGNRRRKPRGKGSR